MERRQQDVIVETDRYRIEGKLTLPHEGYQSRLSDFMNQRDREFFSLDDARITLLDKPGRSEQVPFVMVGRRQIRLVRPVADNPDAVHSP